MSIIRLYELRRKNKYSQKFIAKELGITQAQYSRIEMGRCEISFDKLDKLALLYNTSIDYILGRTDNEIPYPKSKKNLKN